jgi:protoporphyrinogen oxidase
MTVPCRFPYLILGAGPASLGAALALGDSAQILERGRDAGGLCRSIILDGAVLDLGGHSFHTPHSEIRDLVFNALPMVEQKREARCFFQGQWLPYPFQKNIDRIKDVAVRKACLDGLKNSAPQSCPTDNLHDHLEQRFGQGISHHFLRPYNEKIWKSDLRQLASEWTRERVPSASLLPKPFLKEGWKRLPLQADTTVAYPARGSFGEIFSALAQRLSHIRYDERVLQIDPVTKTVRTERGQWSYEKLISTLSLPRLMDLLTVVPASLKKKASELKALPLCLTMITFDGRIDGHVQRIYCAGEESPAHKIVFTHTSSPFLRDLPN